MLKERASDIVYRISEKTFLAITKNIQINYLKKSLANVDYPYNTGYYLAFWITLTFLLTVLAFAAAFAIFITEVFPNPLVFMAPFVLFIGLLAFMLVWPTMELSKKNKQIAVNLPLAILTMSTISEGGAPPQFMFKSIASNPEYPRLGKECAKIQRFMEQLGLSFSKAIAKEMEITSSKKFQKFLKELNTTVRSGGDLREFMAHRADDAYFEYMLQMERAGERAETLGEIYSIIMIAAPLFLFFSVMLLGMFASESGFFGMSVDQLLIYGTWLVIPLANIVFILVMTILAAE